MIKIIIILPVNDYFNLAIPSDN